MQTNGFSIKPLQVKLLAGEQKATETLFPPEASRAFRGLRNCGDLAGEEMRFSGASKCRFSGQAEESKKEKGVQLFPKHGQNMFFKGIPFLWV